MNFTRLLPETWSTCILLIRNQEKILVLKFLNFLLAFSWKNFLLSFSIGKGLMNKYILLHDVLTQTPTLSIRKVLNIWNSKNGHLKTFFYINNTFQKKGNVVTYKHLTLSEQQWALSLPEKFSEISRILIFIER